MRLPLTLALGGLLSCALVRPAAAEPARSLDALVPSSGALALMLHTPAANVATGRRGLAAANPPSASSAEPELTVAVERMGWLEWPVRAFRRPGGAEVIVRGHF